MRCVHGGCRPCRLASDNSLILPHSGPTLQSRSQFAISLVPTTSDWKPLIKTPLPTYLDAIDIAVMARPQGTRGREHGFLLALLLLGHTANCHAQLSKPVANDKHWQEQNNKFLHRRASNDRPDDQQDFDDVVGDHICPLDVELKWMTEISSSVYATPLITDLYADGRKDIIVPGFVHYTEVLEGPDGAKALGWPGFHKSTVHSNPLLYDMDSDGIRDILVATYDGEIVFFKDNGEQLQQRLVVPRLRVRKNWYVGLNPDPVDHSHPDVGKGTGADNPYEKAVHGGKKTEQLKQQDAQQQQGLQQQQQEVKPAAGSSNVGSNGPVQPPQQQQQQQQPITVTGALSVAPPMGVTADAAGSTPPQQQQQQQQGVSAGAGGVSGVKLGDGDKAAVLRFRQHLRDYAKEFGQAAADDMLSKVKGTNREMYDAITAQIAKEKELEQLAGSFGHNQQRQQGQGAAAAGGGGVAHAHRHLLSVDQIEDLSSSSSSSDHDHISQILADQDHRRLLLQDKPAAAGIDGAGASNAAAGSGTTPAAAAAAGVEPDPNQKPLTREALESFKIFADPATGAAAGAQQQQQWARKVIKPEDAAAAAAGGVDDVPVPAAAAADGAQQQQQQQPDQYTYNDDPSSGHSYDEFGDRMLDTPGGKSDGDQAAAAGQQQQPSGVDRGWHDFGYDDSYDGDGRWKDDSWDDDVFKQAVHASDNEYVYIDAHILSTPAIADIDGDGHDELVIAVSYFYDSEYYAESAHAQELQGVDKDKYVAGGIVVFDLRTQVIKWQQHLDLTTATTKFTAHMFSSPTLVDIDACGKMEIIVGTSVGFVYVLNDRGESRPGWPVQMGEVQGQVLVADLNEDGNIEILAGDMLGNVALFDIKGKELWESHVKSALTQNAVAGDIDADGLLEIVFGTSDGRVHAIRGTNGQAIPNFPFQTGGRINAPPTLTHLKKGSTHQHILVMSFDGFLYLIDGKDGCAHTVDIGEASYSAVLVDDLCGDGMLELLVSTMNGNVYMLQTTSPYHAAKTWTAQVQGINGLVSRWGYFGFVATPDGRQLRDVAGQTLQIPVELWDQRTILDHGVPVENSARGPYNVSVILKGVGIAEMNAGPQPVIGVSDVLDKPGKVVIEIPCPKTRTTAAVSLDMTTKHGLHYQDEFVLSFHMHFHKLLKWLIALPLLAMSVVAVIFAQTMGFDSGRTYHLG